MIPKAPPFRYQEVSTHVTIAQIISDAQARIAAGDSNTPRLDAEVLFRHVAGLDRTGLFLSLQDDADDDHIIRFEELVSQRIAGQPVAYLVGHREFMGLQFAVSPDVLIPRPETELLVEWALAQTENLSGNRIDVVDVGSGSGAIAVSIAALASGDHRILAIEPSAAAREVIARNASKLLDDERRSRFSIVDGDLLSSQSSRFGMVVANLPYLTPEQIAGNPALDSEPQMALDGGVDGLDLVNRLIAQLPGHLDAPFAVGLEIDPSQFATVAKLLGQALPDSDISVIKDLAGFDRHVIATRFTKALP